MNEAPVVPITGSKKLKIDSLKIIPGLSQGNPPRKKFLPNSIKVRTDINKSKTLKGYFCL